MNKKYINRPVLKRLLLLTIGGLLFCFADNTNAQQPTGDAANLAPPPPTNLQVTDYNWDGGDKVVITWDLSPEDPDNVEFYYIYKKLVKLGPIEDPEFKLIDDKFILVEPVPAGTKEFVVKDVPYLLELRVKDFKKYHNLFPAGTLPTNGNKKYHLKAGYIFQVIAVNKDDLKSVPAVTAQPFTPSRQKFSGNRLFLGLISLLLCGSVIFFIQIARSGKPLKIRKIAGLEAVDEAVGRATEMGRSCLFIPGIQDMNDIQTIAGMTVLSRVSKTAAEYDAKVEVPTCRALVMTSARETMEAAYLSVGRPDSYNADNVYYVTDEQFGYVAYLQGHMVREKPAACFYMGAFYAESLILAETGNSIGAIQVAGTAMPAQLPFFVAACDYTLIGEEFFAASAYLSGEPEQLGSLKGQDVGKAIVATGIIIGIIIFTLAEITRSEALFNMVDFIKDIILT